MATEGVGELQAGRETDGRTERETHTADSKTRALYIQETDRKNRRTLTETER